jgi:hypothetical protein
MRRSLSRKSSNDRTEFLADYLFIQMTASSSSRLHRACDVAIMGREELHARHSSQIESILRRHHIMDAFFGALEKLPSSKHRGSQCDIPSPRLSH